MKVSVIGTGYVGLTTGLALAHIGHDVCCFDVDGGKIRNLENGRLPIYEPWAAEMLALTRPRLRFTTDPAEALGTPDVIFLAVNTPSGDDGRANLQYVRAAAEDIGRYLPTHHTVVVNKSTVPIGSANLVENLIRHSFAAHRGGKLNGQVSVVSNPEFLREGSAISDSLYPDRVVVGANEEWALRVMKSLYEPLLRQTFPEPEFVPRPATTRVELVETTVVSAEMIKYAANAFLATKISFANELAQLAERSGADIRDVTRGIGLDRRIGEQFLAVGLGWGGSCFGKDTAALTATARDYGMCMHITEAARIVNRRQRELAVSKLQSELKILQGRTIGVLGLAFKPNTDDLRDSASVDIALRLLELGVRVRAHDPCALDKARREPGLQNLDFCESAIDVAEDADAIFLATEWPEYRDLEFAEMASRMRSRIILDGRNFLDRDVMQKCGFRYVGFGR